MTTEQLAIVASIMSYACEYPAYIQAGVRTWLSQSGSPSDTLRRFLASDEWADVWTRAQDAHQGLRRTLISADDPESQRRSVDPRKDYSIPRIVSAFAIGEDEDEAERLGLRLLVSERRRSKLRRRAERNPGIRGAGGDSANNCI